jgi:hypothetical protein
LGILVLTTTAYSSNRDEIKARIKNFFKAAHQHQYLKIYKALSRNLQQEFSPQDFENYIKQIKSADLIAWKLLEADSKLARVKVAAKLKVWYQGKLYEAVYRGRVTLIKERQAWMVDACELEPVSQKLLQNISF